MTLNSITFLDINVLKTQILHAPSVMQSFLPVLPRAPKAINYETPPAKVLNVGLSRVTRPNDGYHHIHPDDDSSYYSFYSFFKVLSLLARSSHP